MAFILLKTNQPLSAEQENALQAQIGQAMGLIGQSADYLLLGLEGGQSLYLRGAKQPAALLQISIFGNDSHQGYAPFSQALTQIVSQTLAIPAANIYIKFDDLQSWAVAGRLMEK
ncbi:hypothetical protein A4G20_09295 [Pasteurellaceae bacterium RH1A]|nr:hypothetical protein A4G20_09295 [Pasteurellaceae bacterium RH1A]